MKILKIVLVLSFLLLFATCGKKSKVEEIQNPEKDNKVLIIHSYYSTSRRVMEHNSSIEKILKNNGIDYDFVYMDTQRNKDINFIESAAISARDKILEYEPEVIITFDDNAFKYVIMKYFKDSDYNVIFAGLDWDISPYNAPYSNTTGMISVTLMDRLIQSLDQYSTGDRVAWLGYNTLTAQKETDAYLNILKIDMDVFLVETVKQWEKYFAEIQDTYDILIHSGTLTSLNGWNEVEAQQYVISKIKIPVGTVNKSAMHCSMLGLVVVPTEQGEWVANRSVELINGTPISEIPVTTNKEGEVYLNLEIAEKLDVIIDYKIIKNATLFKLDEN